MSVDVSKKILVTGHTGYIGSVLVKRLRNAGHFVNLFSGNVADPEKWYHQLADSQIVFHLAAIEYSSSKNTLDDLSVNSISTLHLVEACEKLSLKPKIIFASSSNIFSKVKNLPVTEEHRDSPVSVWSAHKLLSENYLATYSHALNLTAISLRLSNVYGPSTNLELTRRMPLNKMIESAANNSKLSLYENKDCVRDWIYIDDVVDALILSMDINEPGHNFYLIGAENNLTIADYATYIADCVKTFNRKNVAFANVKNKLSAMAMRNYTPDCKKFKNKTGWKPATSLRTGILKTLESVSG